MNSTMPGCPATNTCGIAHGELLVLDEKSPANKPSGGGFGNTVQLPSGQLVSAYTYRGEDGNVHAEVVRWALPDLMGAQGDPAARGDFVVATNGDDSNPGTLEVSIRRSRGWSAARTLAIG